MTHCVVTTASSCRVPASSPLRTDPLQRHVVGQRAVGDHHAGGVGAGVAVGAFQLAGDVEQLVDLRIGVVQRA